MAKRCLRCLGNKTVMGLGWVDMECPACDGLGTVNHEPPKHDDLTTTTTETLEALDAPFVAKQNEKVVKGKGRAKHDKT